ncbi:MAG: hypothetical protein HY361_05430, partial [Candidatus Aenigmarchaeota archaeon]|nr:hypothetical protein [Candidatus Aenigmarchaeota archaeon]
AGVANAAIVSGTGTGVSALDAVEAGNIQANLNLGVTSTTSTITGDVVQLDKSSDHINLDDALNGPFGSNVDEGDLDLLKDVVYVAEDSDTFDAEQKVTLGSPKLTHFQDSDYEDLLGLSDRTPAIGFNISSSQFIMNYTLDFTTDAASDVVGTSSGGDLDDLEGSFLPLFGKSFYVSDWKNGTSTELGTGKLTLLDTGVKGVVKEGEVQTLTLGGTTYDVAIDYIDADSTALSVNGVITSDLSEGQTEKMSDGTYVGITDVRRLEVGGEIGTVEFSLGSGKLELEHKSDIKLNTDTVQGVKAYLYHGAGSTDVDKIVIEWKANDDLFITPKSEITLPGIGGLKFSMTELVRGSENTEEKVTVKNSGKDKIELNLPIEDGSATIGLLYQNTSAGWIGIGEESSKRLATSPQSDLMFWDKKNGNNYHSYFVATYAGTKDAQSYLLDFSVSTDGTRKEVEVINKVTGLTEVSDKKDGDTVTLGDVSFTIQNITENSQNKSVNISAGSGVNFNTVYTPGGLKINLPFSIGGGDVLVADSEASENGAQHNVYAAGGYTYATAGALNLTGDGSDDTASSAGHNNATWYLTFDSEDKDDTLGAGTGFQLRLSSDIGASTVEVEVDQANMTRTFAASGGVQGKEAEAVGQNVYEAYVNDSVAPKLLHYTNGDQDYAEVYYPSGESETYAKVFLTSESATAVPEGGAVLVKDTEVSSVATKNLIIVGGSCINSAAATLVGGAFCGEAWTTATNA